MGLTEDINAARAMGLSYGKYKALTYSPEEPPKEQAAPIPKRNRPKKYTDQQLFELWQQGKTDAQIGAEVGVSRAMIQKWRDNFEIPSSSKYQIDTKKYRMVETKYGLYVVHEDDLL